MANGPLVNAFMNPLNSLFGASNVEASQPPQAAKIPKSIPTGQQVPPNDEFREKLLRVGIPLIAAIAGSANPDILPQAAGLSQGVTQGFKDKEKANRKVFTLDRDGSLEEVGEVPEEAIVRLKTGGGTSAVTLTRDENGVLQIAEPENKNERVKVRNKEGKVGTIPKDQLEQARKQGFEVVK